MKKFFLATLFFLGLTALSIFCIVAMPYYYYNNIVNQNIGSDLFSTLNFSEKMVSGGTKESIKVTSLPNENLWEKYHFEDLRIPLPVKNPFFFVAPIINYVKSKNRSEFGLSIYNINNKVISKVYFLPNRIFPDFYDSQKLFELPIVRKRLKKIDSDKLWEDVFTKKISDWNIAYEQMVYNLYLLEFRSQIFNMKFNKYFYYKDLNTGVIELSSLNKDFKSELVITKRGRTLYSYVIVSSQTFVESDIIRYKFLNEMEYESTSYSLSDILLSEFKALDYEEQIDHKGMLYLLSSWSHNRDRKEFLEKAIFHLERGKENTMQIKPLYRYMNQRYGKTYTQRFVKDLKLKDELLLKRNIELEKKEEKWSEESSKKYDSLSREKDTPLKMLEKAKKNRKKRKDSLRLN